MRIVSENGRSIMVQEKNMNLVNVTEKNREDIIRSYAHRILDDMDFDTIYTFAYEQLVESKGVMDNESLEKEIRDYYPDVLEN